LTVETPPHPVDLHVGARIRLKRKIDVHGFSMKYLAKYSPHP